MKQGRGGPCSFMAPHRRGSHDLEIKCKRRGECSELGGGQEGTSGDSTSLKDQVGNAVRCPHEPRQAGESNGEFFFSHQSAHSPCPTIGFPGCAMSGLMVSCARARQEASLSLKRLAGADFETSQPDYQVSHSADILLYPTFVELRDMIMFWRTTTPTK